MSPFKSLEGYVAGEATFKVADHLIAGCSSILNYNGIRQYLVGPASFVLYKFRGKPVYRLGETSLKKQGEELEVTTMGQRSDGVLKTP